VLCIGRSVTAPWFLGTAGVEAEFGRQDRSLGHDWKGMEWNGCDGCEWTGDRRAGSPVHANCSVAVRHRGRNHSIHGPRLLKV
jgi:hypothetical protein